MCVTNYDLCKNPLPFFVLCFLSIEGPREGFDLQTCEWKVFLPLCCLDSYFQFQNLGLVLDLIAMCLPTASPSHGTSSKDGVAYHPEGSYCHGRCHMKLHADPRPVFLT